MAQSVSKRIKELVKTFTLALLAFTLTAQSSITAFAHTNDDVRRLLGKPPVDTEEFHDYVNYVDSLVEEYQQDEDLEASIQKSTKQSLVGRVKRMTETQRDVSLSMKESLLEGDILLDLRNEDETFTKVTQTLREFVTSNYFGFLNSKPVNREETGEQTEIQTETQAPEQIEQRPIEWYFDEANIGLIQKEIEYRRTLMNDTYDIGLIGYNASMYPIETKKLIITTGFGGTRDFGKSTIVGTYFKSGDKKTDPNTEPIKTLFNGVVTTVKHSETYGNWLEVQSGKGLKISYSFLNEIFVVPGDKVVQGQVIAAGSTNNGEVYVEALLDNNYIDPVLLMDETTMKAHNDWYNSDTSRRGEASLVVFKEVPLRSATSSWDNILLNDGMVEFEEEMEPETQAPEETNAWQKRDTSEDTWNTD